jgi:exodeoxyribonuclease-5
VAINPTDHQLSAVKLAASWYKDADSKRYMFESVRYGDNECMLGHGQDFFFGGFAGTGKTAVLPHTLEAMGVSPEEVAFVAPTGKAAKVMGDKLRDFGIRVTPTTIHKLIYLPKRANADRIQSLIDSLTTQVVRCKLGEQDMIHYQVDTYTVPEAEILLKALHSDLDRAMDNDDGPKFNLRPLEDFPENVKLILCDEGSMVGLDLAQDLASFGRPILAFGDPGQLPPVNDHYGFDCEHPDAFLTEIHRQALDNPIIRLATAAREGKDLKIGDYGNGVRVVDRRNDVDTLNMEREAMVLCGTHLKRWTLTKKIRKELGYTETGPCIGEPLLFCKNSQKLEAMVNGTIVTNLTEHGDLKRGRASFELCVKDDECGSGSEYTVKVAQALFEEHEARKRNAYTASSTEAFKAKKECEQLDWGHVLTVHKSQGSQWDNVIVHDESGAFRDAASRWLYTGITRAAKELTVVV